MNLKKLKQAEKDFLKSYPGGFKHPDMVAIGKKHKVEKMVDYVHQSFSKKAFSNPELVIDHLIKVMSRSSMISIFEKPKFRDFCLAMSCSQEEKLTKGLKAMLHGSSKNGFNTMLDVLKEGKLAKWSIICITPTYFRPQEEVFVKPTTAKSVIQYFELEGLEYKPTPSWDFYENYRHQLLEMKSKVSKDLSPNNTAFSGFLMISAQG